MTRYRVLCSSAVLAAFAALALPAAAPAKITELGLLPEGTLGACPLNCQAVSRTTGYQAKVGPDRTLYQAPADGRIVAWTIALGNPGPKQSAFFSERLGGESTAAIVVLATDKKLVRRAVAKAPLQKLTDYFGEIGPVPARADAGRSRRASTSACRCPSWAPALQLGLGNDSSWRASRSKRLCTDPAVTSTQTALLGNRSSGEFGCLYKTTRLTYSATFIPRPTPAARSR